jgi:hypothetical protein
MAFIDRKGDRPPGERQYFEYGSRIANGRMLMRNPGGRFSRIMSSDPHRSVHRVKSAADLDALVGIYVTGEKPEVFWVDSHGHFQFATEADAREAVNDPYYQQFLPEVDWAQTVIQKVNAYRPYSSDPAILWTVVESAAEKHGVLSVFRKHGLWWAAFGKGEKKSSRTVAVAICLAALDAAGVEVEINHNQIDGELNRSEDPEQSSAEGGLN